MRNTRWISLLGPKARRVILAGGLVFSNLGCHHHYYYYGASPTGQACPPGTTMLPSTVAAGPLCDVPAEGSVSRSGTARSTIISDGKKSKVVISEPSGNRSRYSWQPSDPDASPAMTQVDGALDSSSVRK